MQTPTQIGTISWSSDEIKSAIPLFLEMYKHSPVKDNAGGMLSPHSFATWFMLRKINPANVIESGIWKGHGTWLIEQALPEANIFSIDIHLHFRTYISDRVTYFDKDFSRIDWSFITDKSNTLLFFDDHQNALSRIKHGRSIGFRQFIFEDNYPAKRGDCYSLKKAFQHAGFTPPKRKKGIKSFIKEILRSNPKKSIPPNKQDAQYLKDVLDIYYEFPPLFKSDTTRWGDTWNENDYPTPKSVFTEINEEQYKIFEREARHYTWICYAKLKELQET